MVLLVNCCLGFALTLAGCSFGADADEKSEGSLATVTDGAWTQVAPAGGLPTARANHALVYDPTGRQVILFGGGTEELEHNDTWTYDPVVNTWTDLHPGGDLPPARRFHAMAYDPTSGLVILFGGVSDLEPLADTWAYDPRSDRWIDLAPGGDVPAPRGFHSLVSEPISGKVLLFGGGDQNGDMNDLWAYDPVTNTWSELQPDGHAPSGRSGLSAVWDPVGSRILVFGGRSAEFFNDLWTYDYAGNKWTELEVPDDLPSPRAFQTMVYDQSAGRVLLFGGGADDGAVNDTWAYDPAADVWTELQPAGGQPSGRVFQSMVYHDASKCVVMFGGTNEQAESLNDTWIYRSVGNM